MNKISVENMQSPNGNDVPNQFVIRTAEGRYFQSYSSIIAFVPFNPEWKTSLDTSKWNYSRTTSKYRSLFLGESTSETAAKIKSGEYALRDLN